MQLSWKMHLFFHECLKESLCNSSLVHCNAYQYNVGHSIVTTAEEWAVKDSINPVRNVIIKTTENCNITNKRLEEQIPI